MWSRAAVCHSPHVAGPDRGEDEPGAHGTHRVDLALFAAYCLPYAGFMGLAAFAPDVLATRVLGGVNLAVAYGMGLILGAVALAGLATFLHRGKGDG